MAALAQPRDQHGRFTKRPDLDARERWFPLVGLAVLAACIGYLLGRGQ